MSYEDIGDGCFSLTTESGYYLIKKNGKYGLVNKNRQLITPVEYDYIGIGLDGEFSFFDKMTEKWLSKNLSPIKKNDKWGVLDTKTGKEIVPCVYEEIQKRIYNPSLFFVKKNSKWGALNRLGKTVIPFEYDKLNTYYWDNFVIKSDFFAIKGGEITIFDYKGNPRINRIDDYRKDESYYILKRYGKWGIYNVSTLSENFTFDQGLEMEDVSHHFLTLRNNRGLYAIFDIKKQKYLTDFSFRDIEISYWGTHAYCRMNSDENNFIIDLKNERKRFLPRGSRLLTNFSYSQDMFEIANLSGQWYSGVINVSGDIILPIKYVCNGKSSSPFRIKGDFINVYGKGIFNNKGELVLEGNFSDFFYDGNISSLNVESNSILESNEKIFKVQKYDDRIQGPLYGYYVYNGKQLTEMLPCIYSQGESYYYYCRHLDKISVSDVDKNIPIGNVENNMFAVIIANEKYDECSSVDFATKDGSVFQEYCTKTLGIPSQNIRYRENATLNNIRADINWLKERITTSNENVKIVFYYAGHGIPDEKTATSYLLPVDGLGNDTRSALSLSELYSQLGGLKAKQVTVFLDACFSGSKRDGNMLIKARGVKIKAKPSAPQGNMIVISASQGNETAYQYKKQKHGLFTYFLLKKIQETNGKVTLKELANYITNEVKKTSMDINGKLQTPTIQISPSLNMPFDNITL